ncbi:16S rRNA (cytidine(1402)-2'-O)-methyltransferase [Desulfovibrio ferrophilus]|uniref:Ribosomal RNA small subunit methyltransferase I n=1 Tax=Desulfovibrio ferrophilus TaxID=241368 RepID=A0A2Z6B024_9BACT|nr:ribosomal RNA small subunit methyltransferase I [Desulfovibrio ferrophilus]
MNDCTTTVRPGALYIVATPLGNLGDLSPRAHEVLSGADIVLAEDSRRAGLLFQRLGIKSHGFISFHEHNENGKRGQVLSMLAEGRSVALISDAGTPLMSDPGFTLVRACREAGHEVVPVPGPSAPLTALMACGLAPQPFTFLGFLPRKVGEQRRLFERHGASGATLVFFERKNRLMASLAVAADALGAREVSVARELTKAHEEFILGRLDALDELDVPERGEFTVVIGPPEEKGETSEDGMRLILDRERDNGGKPKEVARRAVAQATGWTAKAAYELLLKMDREETGKPGMESESS